MGYNAPVPVMRETLYAVAGLERLAGLPDMTEFDHDLVSAILEEAGRLAGDVLAPLNKPGDEHGASLGPDGVTPAPGFAEAYAAFRDGGWMGLGFPEAHGGQGLPKALALAVMEMFHGANMAFTLCPMLSFAAIEALIEHGSDEQQAVWLPPLMSGEWTGTMQLTEPQAGSDVGALKTKAVPQDDGSYAITGQKIFITWGDHDMTPNIVHLVLARVEGAPEGIKGISLFLVPKFLLNEDGSIGARNSVKPIGLEKKMGIHASPTCVMEFSGAKGWLVGEMNKGIVHMFTMMNSARLNVGLEGVGVGEAAVQEALAYARERRQGRADGVAGSAPIVYHPDVRRMLARAQAKVMASRAICYQCAVATDLAKRGDAAAGLREDLLVPISKAYSTDAGVEASSLGVQVHGGMGFMNETLAAQYYRDARIAPIYEGTNGIQAIDLVGRKLGRDGGAAMQAQIADVREEARLARETNSPDLVEIADWLDEGAGALEEATDFLVGALAGDRNAALSGASAYLTLAGDVIGGAGLVRGARLASGEAQKQRFTALACLHGGETLAGAGGRLAAITGAGRLVERDAQALFEL